MKYTKILQIISYIALLFNCVYSFFNHEFAITVIICYSVGYFIVLSFLMKTYLQVSKMKKTVDNALYGLSANFLDSQKDEKDEDK